ncbi:MAG: hypothetical protein PSX81_12850 [bacterium]|nr:hypothetical protein [bacterium]
MKRYFTIGYTKPLGLRIFETLSGLGINNYNPYYKLNFELILSVHLAYLKKGLKYLYKGFIYSIEIFILFPPILIVACIGVLISTFFKKKKTQ